MNVSSACDKVLSFVRKFFSLIVALVMAVVTVVYLAGAIRVISVNHSFGKSGFAHFLGIIFSIASVVCYIILHFVPRKAYRLLYALTFLFLATMFLVSHSMGLVAPVVTDCNKLGMLNPNDIINFSTITDLGHVVWANEDDNTTVPIGSLGERVVSCKESSIVFATAFINLILYVVALFDVQVVLLARVKSKTYGERFVEMGISS